MTKLTGIRIMLITSSRIQNLKIISSSMLLEILIKTLKRRIESLKFLIRDLFKKKKPRKNLKATERKNKTELAN
jgi:hypothetical protein